MPVWQLAYSARGFLKLVVASSGTVFGLYAIDRFEHYFEMGTQTPDDTHNVLVNNHGVYKYITESQNHHFHVLFGIGVMLFVVLAAAIIITKTRKN